MIITNGIKGPKEMLAVKLSRYFGPNFVHWNTWAALHHAHRSNL